MKFKTILVLLIILLVIIIFVQNTEIVDFQLYFWEISMSRIILLPALLIIGFICGYVVAKLHRHKSNKQSKNPSPSTE